MRFEDFARHHGLILNDVVINKWVATSTEDHPHKQNGRYKFLGDVGWVQNWATMEKPAMWKSSSPTRSEFVAQQLRQATIHREKAALAAANKASWMLKTSKKVVGHPYLKAKGFPNMKGYVRDGLLVIPMKIGDSLVGAQLINDQGEKKFLRGQYTKGAYTKIDAKGVPIFCEGFATALSIRAVMRFVKLRYCIYVCFSAGNIKPVSDRVLGGIIVADNDPNGVGEQAARNTGKKYWLSDTVGEDFNDYHLRVGDLEASQSLLRILGDSPEIVS
jgi:putative DNA primase/helicase